MTVAMVSALIQVQNVATLACALTIAFALGSWKVSLVNLALLPPLVLVSIMQMRAMGMGAQESQESVAESGKLASEAVTCVMSRLRNPQSCSEDTASSHDMMKTGMHNGAQTGFAESIAAFRFAGTREQSRRSGSRIQFASDTSALSRYALC